MNQGKSWQDGQCPLCCHEPADDLANSACSNCFIHFCNHCIDRDQLPDNCPQCQQPLKLEKQCCRCRVRVSMEDASCSACRAHFCTQCVEDEDNVKCPNCEQPIVYEKLTSDDLENLGRRGSQDWYDLKRAEESTIRFELFQISLGICDVPYCACNTMTKVQIEHLMVQRSRKIKSTRMKNMKEDTGQNTTADISKVTIKGGGFPANRSPHIGSSATFTPRSLSLLTSKKESGKSSSSSQTKSVTSKKESGMLLESSSLPSQSPTETATSTWDDLTKSGAIDPTKSTSLAWVERERAREHANLIENKNLGCSNCIASKRFQPADLQELKISPQSKMICCGDRFVGYRWTTSDEKKKGFTKDQIESKSVLLYQSGNGSYLLIADNLRPCQQQQHHALCRTCRLEWDKIYVSGVQSKEIEIQLKKLLQCGTYVAHEECESKVEYTDESDVLHAPVGNRRDADKKRHTYNEKKGYRKGTFNTCQNPYFDCKSQARNFSRDCVWLCPGCMLKLDPASFNDQIGCKSCHVKLRRNEGDRNTPFSGPNGMFCSGCISFTSSLFSELRFFLRELRTLTKDKLYDDRVILEIALDAFDGISTDPKRPGFYDGSYMPANVGTPLFNGIQHLRKTLSPLKKKWIQIRTSPKRIYCLFDQNVRKLHGRK